MGFNLHEKGVMDRKEKEKREKNRPLEEIYNAARFFQKSPEENEGEEKKGKLEKTVISRKKKKKGGGERKDVYLRLFKNRSFFFILLPR